MAYFNNMFTKSVVEKLSKLETPFYFYDLNLLDKTLKAAQTSARKYNFHIHYAMKANTHFEVLQRINAQGFGADCVSGNEVTKAVAMKFPSDKIAFAGVGKSDKEISIGLENNIFSFNVESLEELKVIDQIAKSKNKMAPIAIRLNPNVNAKTHQYITTGLEENKFGINQWEMPALFELLKELKNIKFIGLHFHIGSQILDLSVFKNLCTRVNELQAIFLEAGFQLPHLNLGGGLGVDYQAPDENPIVNFDEYFSIFNTFLNKLPKQEIHFELGRSLVAQCGSLISKVLFVKKGIKTNFIILDAGMTELMRPALYQAYHKIENLSKSILENKKDIQAYDVVGPICESADCFAKAMDLPETFRGDIFAIRTAGAYGEVMSSNYNLREKVKVFTLK